MVVPTRKSKWLLAVMLFAGCSSNHLPRPTWMPRLRSDAKVVEAQSEKGTDPLANIETNHHEMVADRPALLPPAIELPERAQPAHSVQPQSPEASCVILVGGIEAASAITLPASPEATQSTPQTDQQPKQQPAPSTVPSTAPSTTQNSESANTSIQSGASVSPSDGRMVDGDAIVLTLDTVLQMAEGQNPQIALARERIHEAYARRQRAGAMWLPSLRTGLNYNHHEGTIQDVAGIVFPTNRSSFYGGLGAGAVGAGSPMTPGVLAQFHFADAMFQPTMAGHAAAARQFGATAVRNDMVRDAAIAYLELTRSERAQAIALEAVDKTQSLSKVAGAFAAAGQGLKSDDMRVRVELARRREEVWQCLEQVSISSARLAEVLHADANTKLGSAEPLIVPLDLLPVDSMGNNELDGANEVREDDPQQLASLVAQGLMQRAELAEQKHLVCEAVARMKRERYAPLVPSVLLGLSYGAMGGGLGSSIVNTGDRWDADAAAFWELRNLGIGEVAARRETSSQVRQAQLRKVALLDQVARQVVEAHARCQARRERVTIAQDAIAVAEQSYEFNRQRIENAQGLPIEMLQAIQALATARRSYLDAVIDYNIAQFQLCHATGALVR